MNQSKTYINIQGWMISELELKANDLVLYAIIYGFSQDGRSEFYGSLSYIQKMLNISRNTVIRSLKRLTQKGFVIKTNESRYKAVINNNGGENKPTKQNPTTKESLVVDISENEPGLCQNGTTASAKTEPQLASAKTEPGWCQNGTSTSAKSEPLDSAILAPNNNNTNNTKNNNKYIHKKQKFSALNFLKSKLNVNGEILNNELLKEVISTRKKRKAENSERALKYFCEQIIKANMQSDYTIEHIIEFYLGQVTWKGFKAEWYIKTSNDYIEGYIQEPQKQGQQGLQHLHDYEKQRIKKLIEENK